MLQWGKGGGGGGAKEGVTKALQLHLWTEGSAEQSPGGRKGLQITCGKENTQNLPGKLQQTAHQEGSEKGGRDTPTPALSRGRRSEVRPWRAWRAACQRPQKGGDGSWAVSNFKLQKRLWSEQRFLPSNRLCNFASRQVTSVYCQWRSGKGTAAHRPGRRSFVWCGDASAGIELEAIGQRHAAAALNSGTHVGCGFQRLPHRHREMSHAVGSVLKLSWGWN